MRRKQHYVSPAVLREAIYVPEGQLLAGSVVDNIEKIESTGQDLTDLDFTSGGFNHDWQDQ